MAIHSVGSIVVMRYLPVHIVELRAAAMRLVVSIMVKRWTIARLLSATRIRFRVPFVGMFYRT